MNCTMEETDPKQNLIQVPSSENASSTQKLLNLLGKKCQTREKVHESKGTEKPVTCERVVLSTNVRDETNLPEWIAYHLAVGFSHIFVVDHLSKIPVDVSLKNAFSPKVSKQILNRVTVHRFKQESFPGMKSFILEKLCHPFYKKSQADWGIHLDADEYWNPVIFSRGGDFLAPLSDDERSLPGEKEPGAVQQFLQRFREDEQFKRVGQIGVNWLLFGSSYFDKQPPGLVLQKFTLSSAEADWHVKSFVRPHAVRSQKSPHFTELQPGFETVDVFGRPIAAGANGRVPPCPFSRYAFQDNRHIPLAEFPCLIHHYYCQSYEKYIERKLKKRRDDTGAFRKPVPPQKFHTGSFHDLQSEKHLFKPVNCNQVESPGLSRHFSKLVASMLCCTAQECST